MAESIINGAMTPPSLREVLTRALLSLLSGRPAATPPFPGWPALRGGLGGLAVALFFLWFHLSARDADRGLFAIVGRIILGLLALLAFLSLIAWVEFAWAMHRREHQAALRISLGNALLAALPACGIGACILEGRDLRLVLWLVPPVLLALLAPLWPLAYLLRPRAP